jgi:hypothetical protein
MIDGRITIADIAAQYRKGGIYNNKYQVLIDPPKNIYTSEFTKKLWVLSKSATIPKKSTKPKTINIHGVPVTFKGQFDYGESTSIEVYEDSELNVLKTLEKWIEMSDGPTHSWDKEYYNGSISVFQLDGEGNRLYGVKYLDVFLTEIGEIKYTGDSGNLLTYTLNFSYSTWEVIDTL